MLISQQPELGPGSLGVLPFDGVPPSVNSGVFNVEHANLFNIEAAARYGRFVIQSEYRWSVLDLPSGDTTTVSAGYVQCRLALTGEIAPYQNANGTLGRIQSQRPFNLSCGDWGAWEVATRLSTIDLNPIFGLPGVPGPARQMNLGTLALNWYPIANVACHVQGVRSLLDDPVLGGSASSTLAARTQLSF